MTKFLKPMLAIGALLLATIPAVAAPPPHFRGAVVVGPVFGPAWGPWGYYGYGPYSYYGGYARAGGEIKIDSKAKDAEVFVNGAYAGTVKEMKSMWLRPGTYDLELRARGGEKFAEKVYVVAGKTVHIRPDLPENR
jgi:hypothetical protein